MKLPAEEKQNVLKPFKQGMPVDEETLRKKFKGAMKDLELVNKKKITPAPTVPGPNKGPNE